jgi:hypothetical protein
MMVEVIKKELDTSGLRVSAFHIWDETLLMDFMKNGGLSPWIISFHSMRSLRKKQARTSLSSPVQAPRPLWIL